MHFTDRLTHAWNAFRDKPSIDDYTYVAVSESWGNNPNRSRPSVTTERSVINSIINRIAIDVADISVRHVRVDDKDRLVEVVKSGVDYCFNIEANIDQSGIAFRQDIVQTLLEKGVVAVVPVDTSMNPLITNSYDINTMRVGTVVSWMPKHVKVRLYNDITGREEEIRLPKKQVAIIENPLYSVMNERNSTLRRLIQKLDLLDAIDKQSGSGKLDLIFQVPYTTKTDAQKQRADKRRKELEAQLKDSKFGIAYTDSTEKITQLNRPIENNMLKQVEFLTSMLYNQLGLTEKVFNGTADEKEMLNYHNRTIKPILVTIVSELERKFITKTSRTQGQRIRFVRDPFSLIPMSQIADLADKLTRNEVMTSNEVRSMIGLIPFDNPRADELRNKNLTLDQTGGPSMSLYDEGDEYYEEE